MLHDIVHVCLSDFSLNTVCQNVKLFDEKINSKLLDIVPNHLVRCVIQKRYSLYNTCFISENWTSLGSALRVATLKVSPSTFEILKVRSSDPKANKFASLHAPQVIALLCFPTTGTFLDVL